MAFEHFDNKFQNLEDLCKFLVHRLSKYGHENLNFELLWNDLENFDYPLHTTTVINSLYCTAKDYSLGRQGFSSFSLQMYETDLGKTSMPESKSPFLLDNLNLLWLL